MVFLVNRSLLQHAFGETYGYSTTVITMNIDRERLNSIDWDEILLELDIDACIEKINQIVIHEAKMCIPYKTVVIRRLDPPWFSNSLRKLIRKRKRQHSKAKCTNDQHDWARFRVIRNHTVNVIRNAKNDYFKKLSTDINNCKGSQKWWKLIGR